MCNVIADDRNSLHKSMPRSLEPRYLCGHLYDYECGQLYDCECGHVYDHECEHVHDYECRNYMTTNVADDDECRDSYDYACRSYDDNCVAETFPCPAFPRYMEIRNCGLPQNFSKVQFFLSFPLCWMPGMLDKSSPLSLFAFLELIPGFPGFRGNGVKCRRFRHPNHAQES